jgi:hypothetical protein
MPGLFILSLDTEIAWGTYDPKALARHKASFDNYRILIRRLLELLDRYSIPATFAVVGHLFLERCNGHPDVLQPHYTWAREPDSARDPCSGLDHAPWYYGPDIVTAIREAKTPHEIGTHSFTHVLAGDSAVTEAIWRSQLAKSAAVHEEHSLRMLSLVHPQEKVAFTECLPEYGIIAYRGEERKWYGSFPRPLARICHLLDRSLALPPPTYDLGRLRVNERLVNLPASQFLMSYDGIRKWIPTESRVRQAKAGLERAITNEHLYHLWFHPFNLGSSEFMFKALERILQEVDRQRDAGRLHVMTMAQAAQWILDGMPAHAG